MYDCLIEVISKEVSAKKALPVIEQTTIDLEDAGELFAEVDLTGAI